MSARPRSPSEQCEDPQEVITLDVPEPMQVGVSDKAEDGSEASTSTQEELSQSDNEEELTSKLKGTYCGLNNLLNVFLLRFQGLIKGSSTK